jgi:predicted dehydrogenase
MLRVAYIGTGHVVEAIHLPAMGRVRNATLTGGYDLSARQRLTWERATRTPGYASVDELFDRAKPDVVVIATPPDSHVEHCVRALEFGAHVICEKPVASSVLEADQIASAAAGSGRAVAVNHHFRYQPIFSAIKSAADSGRFGEPTFCQISQHMDLPPWDEPAPWRAAMAHRSLLESGIHFVDLLLHLFGRLPREVAYHRSAGPGGPGTAEAVQLLTLDFGDGRLAQLTIDRLCRAATRYGDLRLDCTEASLRASIGGRMLLRIGKERASRAGVRVDYGRGGLAWYERGLRRRVLARNPVRAEVPATARLISEALDAFTAGRPPPSDLAQARAALAVIEAAYRFAECGSVRGAADVAERSEQHGNPRTPA